MGNLRKVTVSCAGDTHNATIVRSMCNGLEVLRAGFFCLLVLQSNAYKPPGQGLANQVCKGEIASGKNPPRNDRYTHY
jgi:hypothetical protein